MLYKLALPFDKRWSSYGWNCRVLTKYVLFFFNINESAVEANGFLVKAYRKAASNKKSYRKWSPKYKNEDFDVKNNGRSLRPKMKIIIRGTCIYINTDSTYNFTSKTFVVFFVYL